MKIANVTPARVWKHKSGRTASIYGACPWYNEAQKAEWTLVQVGWTWELSNGTVGLGRVPAKTLEEAEAVMATFNARFAPKA